MLFVAIRHGSISECLIKEDCGTSSERLLHLQRRATSVYIMLPNTRSRLHLESQGSSMLRGEDESINGAGN